MGSGGITWRSPRVIELARLLKESVKVNEVTNNLLPRAKRYGVYWNDGNQEQRNKKIEDNVEFHLKLVDEEWGMNDFYWVLSVYMGELNIRYMGSIMCCDVMHKNKLIASIHVSHLVKDETSRQNWFLSQETCSSTLRGSFYIGRWTINVRKQMNRSRKLDELRSTSMENGYSVDCWMDDVKSPDLS